MDNVIWVNGHPVTVVSGQFDDHQEPRTLIRFMGPVLPEWRRRLVRARITIEFWCPPLGACVTLPSSLEPRGLRTRFPFIAGAKAYVEAECQRFDAAHGIPIAPTPLPPQLVDIVCFSKQHRVRVEKLLARQKIRTLAVASSKLRVWYAGDLAVIRDLPGVKLVDRPRLPRLLSAIEVYASLAIPAESATTTPRLDGRGEIIGVADTGLDRGVNDASLHPDFRGRVKSLLSLPMNKSWRRFAAPRSDDAADRGTSHGTHVAGLALGSGDGSGGLHRGVAPGARLVFQAIEQDLAIKPEFQAQFPSGFYLAGRPLSLHHLFEAAQKKGARVHVNSWGDETQGAYTDDCHEADLFLHQHPDAVILVAAGNSGTDRDGNRIGDSGSVWSPACAKNVIAIAATEGPLTGVGQRGTWGDMDPRMLRWRAGDDRNDPVSGEPTRIAPFSSCGPTRDGRIKPDLAAPGSNIPGPRSQVATASGWGLADPLPLYMYEGGTSVSAGLAGGAAALVRQAWRSRKQDLSGAALKALLILGAAPVAGRARGGTAGLMEAGYGLIRVSASLPPSTGRATRGSRTVMVQDVKRGGINTGARRRYRLKLGAGAKLRVVLCWYDVPGERLINDLDLSVTWPDGTVQFGNQSDAHGTVQPDRVNTVEVIECGPLQAGTYVVTVAGANVPEGPQNFAVAYAVEQPA